MTTAHTSDRLDGQTPSTPGVCFAETHGGLLVAKVGDTAFAMVPGANGSFFVASAWRLRDPMEEWKRSDFYGHSGEVADIAAFRVRVHENAEHQRQRAALTRREVFTRASTPWGPSQQTTVYADGVGCHSTASHGGFHLDAAHNTKVHRNLCVRGGWYEEDCAWAAVAQAFPELFTDYERCLADNTIRDWYPDTWEAIHGRTLQPGESHEKDRRRFEQENASDWIVISALRSNQHPGMTECVASLGGDRRAAEQRRYLVASDEYRIGRFGFVIDEARHRLYDGPSGFVGWR